jgi:choline dehydrogenase
VQGPPLLLEIGRWLVGWPSLLAVSPSLVFMFWKSQPGLSRPDLQCVFTPASFREGVVGLLDKTDGMTFGVWPSRPESRGFVRTQSRDISEQPKIQPNFLADPTDQAAMIGGIQLGRKALATPPLQRYLEGTVSPPREVQSDDEILAWARANGTTVYHMIGTAKMGPASDSMAVVDHQLRVHGVSGLRVADASIMPTMPSGNTNAPAIMIGERAADWIRGRTLAPVQA